MSRSTAVTFDLWRTLIAEPGGHAESAKRAELRPKAICEILGKHGITDAEGIVQSAFNQMFEEILADHAEGKDMLYEDRVDSLISNIECIFSLSLERARQEVADAFDSVFLEHPPVVLDGAVQAVQRVRELGSKTALISNTGPTSPGVYRRWLAARGLGDLFDVMIFSNEISRAKPDPQMFLKALEYLGVQPLDAMHVGDNPYADISGAVNVGMTALWLDTSDQGKPARAPHFIASTISEAGELATRWVKALRNI